MLAAGAGLRADVAQVEALLGLKDAAYVDARDRFLDGDSARADVAAFVPATVEGRWLKRALEGWLDHAALYARLRPRFLEIESAPFETRRGPDDVDDREELFAAAERRTLVPRLLEVVIFERVALQVETARAPAPRADWRIARLFGELEGFLGEVGGDAACQAMRDDVFEPCVAYTRDARLVGPLHVLVGYSTRLPTLSQLEGLAADASLEKARRESFAAAARVLRQRLARAGVLGAPEGGGAEEED